MAREGVLGGFIDLFAWAVAFTTVWTLTQPMFKNLEGAIIGIRHKGGGGPNGGV
jgi:hypothetical protein